MWLEKSCRQNPDRAKSWKNQFLNTFWVGPPFHILRCLCHLCSSLEQKPETSILNTFWNKCWIEKKATRTKIVPKGEEINFWVLFWLNIYIYSLFLLILSVQKKDQEKCLCHLFCEKRVRNFTFWDVCAIYLVVMGTKAPENKFEYFLNQMLNRKKLPPEPRSRQKLRKSIFEYFLKLNLNRNQLPPKPRSCQKLEKSIFKFFFNGFWLEKSCHQNQDRTKS